MADYDCDGATAVAVAVRGLRPAGRPARLPGADRVVAWLQTRHLAAENGADLLITVDNGIASVDGVAEAKGLGLQVLVTDHHLPGAELPEADAIVNPNQPGLHLREQGHGRRA